MKQPKNSVIKKLAFKIREKLSKFEKHYFKKNIYIVVNDESFPLDEMNFHLEVLNSSEIKIYVNYNSIKIQGLENYFFSFEKDTTK